MSGVPDLHNALEGNSLQPGDEFFQPADLPEGAVPIQGFGYRVYRV